MPDWNEQYHSKNGSINETYHVFINSGLKLVETDPVSILEIGFGTGLNCFITYLESEKPVDYVGVEAYPVSAEEVEKMNFISVLKAEKESEAFNKIHSVSWEEKRELLECVGLPECEHFSLIAERGYEADSGERSGVDLGFVIETEALQMHCW